ncbi:MAG: S49 family peptidase, partial [Candidatus Altiarchaeota archaeon]
YRPMTNSEKEELESLVNKVFENFIFEIAENRNLSFEYVKSIADGSIYLGEEAKKLGLIDEVGNMDDAIRIAQELAGIKGKANVKEISKRKTIFDLFSIEE